MNICSISLFFTFFDKIVKFLYNLFIGGGIMIYSIKLPKILYLIFLISKFAKSGKYYNTNDLNKLANNLQPDLVRLRQDKNDYKFLDDTKFGGSRGNFSINFQGIY